MQKDSILIFFYSVDMDLLTLLQDLKELKCKVMSLGLHLKVPKEIIEVFEKEHTKDYDRIFIEVLDFWRKNCSGDKRKCLCEAVSHVGSTALKEKIQEKYGESGKIMILIILHWELIS